MLNRPKDFYAGVIFAGLGVAAFVWSQRYDIGSASQMGPGYLPAMMGVVLIVLGAFSIGKAVRVPTADPIERQAIAPFVLVVASVVAFALLIDSAGLVVALFALVFISCFTRALKHPIEVLLTYAGLSAFSVGVFWYGLHMPVELWWR
jgi:putative tricarboxylic transport membrane protein